ncbi:MAG: formyltransferase family protein [Magnetospiraceae bacterium]
MKVLLLSPYAAALQPAFEAAGDMILVREDPVDAAFLAQNDVDFIVSYGYRHILRAPVIDALPGRVINLHISFLPFNRGAHPNFWSYMDDTPKGVTIHRIDAGVDTGEILVQRQVDLSAAQTFVESYECLSRAIEALFIESWPGLRAGDIVPTPQTGSGSLHRRKDLDPVMGCLPQGWDTPIQEAVARYKARSGV